MLHILTRIILSFILTLTLSGILSITYLVNKAKASEVIERDLGQFSQEINVIEKVQNRVAAEKQEYEDLSRIVKEKELQHREYSKEIIKIIENNLERNSIHDEEDTSIAGEMLGEFHQMSKSIGNQKDRNSCNGTPREDFKIFISFSMPKELIKNYDEIARRIGAKVIIRGLINNSFKDTISYIKESNDQGMMIDIDPRPFEEYQINLVPSFVISDEKNEQKKGEKFDKLVGNVSIIYALEQFANSGDFAEKAKEYLRRLNEKSS